jgi:3-dehydroquinate dehydratase type I
MTRICVSITEANVKDAIESIGKAKELGADLIELRMDYLGKLNDGMIGDLIDTVDIPKIATLRKADEGGFYKGEESGRINFLLTALSFGAQYIDLEVSTDVGWRYEISKACKSDGSKLIVSYHNFNTTPSKEELIDICRNEYAAGADIAKITTMPQSFEDIVKILSVVEHYKNQNKDIIGIAMGKFGKISRVLTSQLGSFLTYASLEKGKESAEGQLTIAEMKEVLKILEG